MAPEDIIQKILQATTHFHLNLETKNQMIPQMHMKLRAPGLQQFRQNESISSNTFFPAIKIDQGKTCSQLFVGQKSKRREVFPLKSEFYNGKILQD